ncbi:hypothetical protein HYDPIDRAFT_140079 [Hydnomerulius pinastri MD-312]|uniref:AB hydrolase-1 domain-containing protein n=1 Tax=Hydnomerulius pinastri MD-312 TaxID=994086 RepID=A0A0C9W9F4_9AGAM|nr:hypothetical protein HYDPIDRAFT_140079 [Hydnomerulius pinastri MD-312]
MVPGAPRVFCKSYVFDPRPRFPFRITAKRYCAREPPASDAHSNARSDALTLVFAHAGGVHKEHWEPIIHRLFEEHSGSAESSVSIEDMWTFAAPNHGDAAELNEEPLAWGYEQMAPWEDYGRGIHAFLAGLGTGVDVNFSQRRLVAVGHSMGAVAMILSTTFFPLLKFSSMHLIVPMLVGKKWNDFGLHLEKSAEKRRDIWPSAEDAFQTMKSRPTWRKWDERVLRIYTEHGLRPLPTAEYPDRSDGVTLKCTGKQEAAMYRDHKSRAVAYKLLPHLVKEIPTHITYGEVDDFVPAEWQNDVLNNASGGIHNFASVTKVPDAGHLIAQSHPDAVADVIWTSLLQSHSHPPRDTSMVKL